MKVLLLAFLVVGLLLLAGCTGSASTNANANGGISSPASPNPSSAGSPGAQSNPTDTGVIIAANATSNNSVNLSGGVMTDTKTGYEKTQEAIAAIVPDGTYHEQTTYAYHSGTEKVNISISVKGDIVTEASVVVANPTCSMGMMDCHMPNPISAKIISSFNAALPKLVVGQKIDQLSIPHNVAGSSLTTAVFKAYVDTLVQTHGAAS